MVWKSTTELGVGKALFKKIIQGRLMLCGVAVLRYRKAGNVDGQYKANVQIGFFDFERDNVCGKKGIQKKSKFDEPPPMRFTQVL